MIAVGTRVRANLGYWGECDGTVIKAESLGKNGWVYSVRVQDLDQPLKFYEGELSVIYLKT